MPSRPVLVTGCARSGTGYTAALLSRLGLPCGHERLFEPAALRPFDPARPDAAPPWPARVAAESSWLAAPFVAGLPEGTLVVHQVRHPLAVLRSNLRIGFFSRPSAYLEFASAHLPGLDQGAEIERAALYWIGWNTLIERASSLPNLRYLRLRLEDLDERVLRELAAAAGLGVAASEVRAALSQVPRDANTRGRRSGDGQVRLEDLLPGPLGEALQTAARRYGYADISVPLPRGRLPESLSLF